MNYEVVGSYHSSEQHCATLPTSSANYVAEPVHSFYTSLSSKNTKIVGKALNWVVQPLSKIIPTELHK